MILTLEIVVIVLLALCVCRGLHVWHKHRIILSEFEGNDLKAAVMVIRADSSESRKKAWIARNFLLVSFAIVLSMVDFCLRLNWSLQHKWASSGDIWAYAWLFFHLGLCAFFLKSINIAHAALTSIEDWEGIGNGG